MCMCKRKSYMKYHDGKRSMTVLRQPPVCPYSVSCRMKVTTQRMARGLVLGLATSSLASPLRFTIIDSL